MRVLGTTLSDMDRIQIGTYDGLDIGCSEVSTD